MATFTAIWQVVQHYLVNLHRYNVTEKIIYIMILYYIYIGNRSQKKLFTDIANLGAFANIFVFKKK